MARQRGRNQGDGGGRNRGQRNEVFRDARRDVMLSLRPYLQGLRRERQQSRREANQSERRSNAAGAELASSLEGIAGQYGAMTAGLPGQLTSQIGGLNSLLGSSNGVVPEAERAAGAGAVGAIGAGTLETLASNDQRNAAYNTSAQRQGAIQQNRNVRNIEGALRDRLSDIGDMRLDALALTPAQIQQRMDALRQQRFDRMLAMEGLKLDQGYYGIAQQQQAAAESDDAFWNDFYTRIYG